jgi:hypothetical protein
MMVRGVVRSSCVLMLCLVGVLRFEFIVMGREKSKRKVNEFRVDVGVLSFRVVMVQGANLGQSEGQ